MGMGAAPSSQAPKPKPKRKRAATVNEKDLTAKERKRLEKLKKKKEMTPEERMMDRLNVQTKAMVLRYFVWFTGPLLVISLTLTLFATLNGDTPEFLDASHLLDRSRLSVLNDYDSWDTFASECCCLVTEHPDPKYNLTERWVCRADNTASANFSVGGRTVDRARVLANGVDTGLPIRGRCERQLDPAREVILLNGNSTVELRSTAASLPIPISRNAPSTACGEACQTQRPSFCEKKKKKKKKVPRVDATA